MSARFRFISSNQLASKRTPNIRVDLFNMMLLNLVLLLSFTFSSNGCSLHTYRTTYIRGLGSLAVRYERGFGRHLNIMNSYARRCGVKVWVTHAFRKTNQRLTNTVVDPATRSNHLVGHAIDFNLVTPSGWCNSNCLRGRKDIHAECFIQNVMNNGLRWFRGDPVHMDDGLNLSNPNEWNALFLDLQNAC